VSHYQVGAASKAEQRQRQLDRTQQTFDAAASVAQSIMAQVEAFELRLCG